MNRVTNPVTRIGWVDAYATAVWIAALCRVDPSFIVLMALAIY